MIDGSDQLYRTDKGVALRFFYEPSRNNFLSEKAGRSVFDTSLVVEVITPGSTESMPRFEVERTLAEEAGKGADGGRIVKRGTKYEEYAPQIEAFKKQNGEYADEGTPITQWGNVDVGTAASLKAVGIHTVEMLAAVSDGNLMHLGTGGRTLRDQAIAFLNTRQFGVPSAQMAAETASLRNENERLKAQIADLEAKLAAASKPVPVEPIPVADTPSPLVAPDPLSAGAPPAPPPLV